MKRLLGVTAAGAVLAFAGCGGVPELEPDEIETVNQAKSVATAAAAGKPLDPADKKKLKELMILCHQKPLAETDGDSVREIMTELTPKVKKGADPTFFKRMKRVADHGCG